MALGIEMLVERVFSSPGRIVGDDCDSAFSRDGFPQTVAVVSSVGHDCIGGKAFDESVSLRRVALLAGGEREADGAAKTANDQMDFGAQTAAGAAKGLIFRPPFLAPAAC